MDWKDRVVAPIDCISRFSLYLIFAAFMFALGHAPPLHASSGTFVWAVSMGQTLADYGRSIAVDSDGNVYTIGEYQGTVDFNPGGVPEELTSQGSSDVFITKSDSNGNLVWVRTFGGNGDDLAGGICVDIAGNVYGIGWFSGDADFDEDGTPDHTSAGLTDVFIVKLATSNGDLLWSGIMGGTQNDYGRGIAVDSSGNIYAAGSFTLAADLDPGAGVDNRTSNGGEDIFISKLNSSGNPIWIRTIGSTGSDYARGVAVDSSGNVCTIGEFQGTVDFNPGGGTAERTSNGFPGINSWDVFINKLDNDGNFLWVGSFGGEEHDNGTGIAVDSSGNVYITGDYQGLNVDFDPGAGEYLLTSLGAYSYDVFVAKLNANGGLVWARSMGGTNEDNGSGITVDTNGSVYATGGFRGIADFNPASGTYYLSSRGLDDIFIARLSSDGYLNWARSMGGTGIDIGRSVAVDAEGYVHTTGEFTGTVDFDPGTGSSPLTSNGDVDIFISKLDGRHVFCWPMFMPAIEHGAQR